MKLDALAYLVVQVVYLFLQIQSLLPLAQLAKIRFGTLRRLFGKESLRRFVVIGTLGFLSELYHWGKGSMTFRWV